MRFAWSDDWSPEECIGCKYFELMHAEEIGENRRVALVQCTSQHLTAGGCCDSRDDKWLIKLKRALRYI